MRFPSSLLLHLLLLSQLETLLFNPCESVLDGEIAALRAFKLAISEDPFRKLSDWSSSGDPCSWSGIKCSDSKNTVISLNFSNSSLKGFLAEELGSLNSLQELILENNLFYGTIPSQISMLKSLKVLDLSVNRLLGPIPSDIGGLISITTINLNFNGLTGIIPPELGSLVNLVELHLERNELNGPLPGSESSNSSTTDGLFVSDSNSTAGLCLLTKLEVADFSYNFFQGKIPTCLKNLPRSNFQVNCFEDEDSFMRRPSQQCMSVKSQEIAEETTYEQSSGRSKHRRIKEPLWLMILEMVTGAALVVFLVVCIVHTVKRCKSKSNFIIHRNRTQTMKDQISISMDDEFLKNVMRYSREDLEQACEDFSNIIGSSANNIVYKGTVKDGVEIAVISLSVSVSHWPSYLELCFQKEVDNLARLNHENTSKLLGYCKESEPFSRMFVFEYASNGTLYEHLHYGDAGQLSWLRRMNIAIGVARGLRYLHTEVQPPFTISELNSNAIYLTEDFSPKLVDFERWNTIVSRSDNGLGYSSNGSLFNVFLEASSEETWNMDVQGNTYAFGVLLVELISGRSPNYKDRGSIVDWALDYLGDPNKMSMLVDPEIKNVKIENLSVLGSVIGLCTDPEPSKRPSMDILCAMLEDGIDTSAGAIFRDSSLAWADLVLSQSS